MASFYDILEKYRRKAFSERDKGTRFELLMQRFMQSYPLYQGMFVQVWMWNEFPFKNDFGGKDIGIDLVALTADGEYWAVQCKCYAENSVIDKPAVDSFLSTSGKSFVDDLGQVRSFSQRLWIATTNHWNKTAEIAIQNQQPQVSRISLLDLQEAPIDWEKLDEGIFGEAACVKKYTPRLHQQNALEKAREYFKDHERGKMIMACGTGKTATSLWIAEQETNDNGFILFLVPSIALLAQSLMAWSAQSSKPITAICVCSDAGASKDNSNDENKHIDLALPATTNVEMVASRIRQAVTSPHDGMVVVFSTYQSIDVVSNAQRKLQMAKNVEEDYSFDFIICDEAHRTTGYTDNKNNVEASNFVKVHDNDFIRGKKRLYMTATPKLFGAEAKKKAVAKDIVLWSMDDESLYGEEFYRIGFSEAVDKKLLADYKVMVLTIGDDQIPPVLQDAIADKNSQISTDDASKLIGCINALSKKMITDSQLLAEIDPAPMHTAVAFCATIKKSKQIVDVFNEYKNLYYDSLTEAQRKETVIVEADHVDGSMGAVERGSKLSWLKNVDTSGRDCNILANVRCLSEGVDVPSLDAILFLSARNSQVDVVQSVGRVMRTAPNKNFGYIIIPVVVPANVKPEEALEESNDFATVWSVLNALRAHDDRFNATINKIELNKNKPDNILVGGVVNNENSAKNEVHESSGVYQTTLYFSELQGAIYARMVQKVGSKRYWSQWAEDIAKIAERHRHNINTLISKDERHKKAFEKFMQGLHKNINPYISTEEAVEMLAQHIITKPVFEALFENYSFVENNTVSQSMAKILALLDDDALEKEHETLERFYNSVRMRCEGIDSAEAKQKIITELYDNFFRVALKTTVEKLGIVYTPVEVVDFILHSVNDVLKKEFGRSMSDSNVHILDPFTGTGTFITRLLQSGIIKQKDLIRKYTKELHANEIVLLAYYIASINIENAFHDLMQGDDYTSFDGICLTDTFQLGEKEDTGELFSEVFPYNSMRVQQQKLAPIRVIVGNPPYSVGQKSANDNAQNESYPHLEKRLSDTYVAGTKVTNKNALYDSYIKAFRWASDRIDAQQGGVIGFVTNGGWLDGNAMDGMRKCLEKEFSAIYVFNLRGNQRTQGELSRKEGGKIFGSGSRSPICITILVKNPKALNKTAEIFYHDIGDYLSREDKLKIISKFKSCLNSKFPVMVLKPNAKGDWINQRNGNFESYISLEPDKKFNTLSNSYFVLNSRGTESGRDIWVYNFSRDKVKDNIQKTVAYYNKCVEKLSDEGVDCEKAKDVDASHISWSSSLSARFQRGTKLLYEDRIVEAEYRPFCRSNLYWGEGLIHRRGQFDQFFPTSKEENLVICVSGIGVTKQVSCMICDGHSDLEFVGKSQCFPLYYYEENKRDMPSLFDEGTKCTRRDGVTDFILKQAQGLYGKKVTKEDIFYYVYGFLHLPSYREEYAADLKKSLPRLPLVDEPKKFWQFSKAGRQLADIHLNYENQPYPDGVKVEGAEGNNFRVEKLKFKSKTDKSALIYNSDIQITNIPDVAHEYIVNGRSPLEWIIDRYQVKQDKASGIINDCNKWGEEHGNPRYILDLILSCITVSIKTMEIVDSLPEVNFE